MPDEEIRKRRIWQEEVYQKLASIKEPIEVEVLGKIFIVYPGVFAPIWGDSIVLARAVQKEVNYGDSVLDLGTGTGIQGIFAAQKASKVIATDISPLAVECAKYNVHYHGLEHKIEVIETDLFSNIKEKFDLIIYNPPVRWFKPRDILETTTLDKNYSTLNRFFNDIRCYLRQQGRILIVFSDAGDICYFENLIKKYKYKSKVADTLKKDGWEYEVYLLT